MSGAFVSRRIVILFLAALLVHNPPSLDAQQPPMPGGWVVIPVDEYRVLRQRAFPPDPPADVPVTVLEWELFLPDRYAAKPIAGNVSAREEETSVTFRYKAR